MGGQSNPLAFSARQRVGPTVEGQVIETDAVKERETRFDFFEDFPADEEAALVQHFGAVGPRLRRAHFSVGPPCANQRQGFVNRGHRDFRQTKAADRDAPSRRVELLAMT